jgi:hypothetical protein
MGDFQNRIAARASLGIDEHRLHGIADVTAGVERFECPLVHVRSQISGGFMPTNHFGKMRRKILREHKHSIIRSALKGHKNKGLGLVLVKFNKVGMVHLSYLTLDTLKQLHTIADPKHTAYGAILIEKVSKYLPGTEIPVVVTDGECEQFSFGIRQVTQ